MPSKATELRELPDEELLARIDAAKEELFNLRFQLATGQLDNPSRLKQVRHDLARIATVLRERELESELETIVAEEERSATSRRARPSVAPARCERVSSSRTRWTRRSSSGSIARCGTRSTARR